MARDFTESFEAGTVGANQSGTVFTPSPTAGALVVSAPSAAIAHGTKAIEISTPATATNRLFVRNFGAERGLYFVTMYAYLTAYPPVEVYPMSVTSAGAGRASWRITSTGTIVMRNVFTAVYTSTQTVPLNTLVRFEWRLDQPAGQQQLRVYTGHSTTPLWDSGNQTFTAGTFNALNLGIVTSVANTTYILDWAAGDDATWTGPAVLPAPTAAFTRTPTSGQAPLTVAFTDTSTGSPTSWSWDFGDGSAVSTVQNPSHVYSTTGTRTVTLTATNTQGSTTATQTVTVTGSPPVASFSPSGTAGTAPFAVTFTNTSTGSPTSYAWNFGDGGTATTASPSHTFAAAGTYTVTMTATNVNGTSTPATATITVAAAGGGGAPAGGGLATYVMDAGVWKPITIWVWVD